MSQISPVIDYTPLHEFAQANRISYNELCVAVAQAVVSPSGSKAKLVLAPWTASPAMIEAAEQVEDLYRRGTPETWGKVYRAMLMAAQ